jgi:ferredoxin-type protein NapG
LKACTGCNDCLLACPHQVIRKAGPELGKGAGTPVIVPEDNPCLLCEDLPCIAACEEGALVPPPEGERASLGLAVVDANACVQLRGEFCDDC